MGKERRRYGRVPSRVQEGQKVTTPDGFQAVVIEKAGGKVKVRYDGEQTVGIYTEDQLLGGAKAEPEAEEISREEPREVSADG